jgi:hypothetical protein
MTKSTTTQMKLVASSETYDYYVGNDDNGYFYNIVPVDSGAPNGGYAKEWILGVKHAPDLFPAIEVKEIDFTRVNNNVNGHPRLVCHFFNFLTESERDSYGIDNYRQLYSLAVSRARKIHGKRFHNKQYGGGVVFATFDSPKELTKRIQSIQK